MAGPTARPRLDERVLVAGTTVRFAQLLVLIGAASIGMTMSFLGAFDNEGGLGCFLAAGGDPLNLDSAAISSLTQRDEAYYRCIDRFDPPPPWWIGACWTLLTAATALTLFRLHPVWTIWRRRLEPLEAQQGADEIREHLTRLAEQAALARLPRIAVDPDPLAQSPFVFGRNRSPVVLVPKRLLRQWKGDGAEASTIFRAVMLHEFAHIRNRDITVTYATVTLWRAFATTTLLPFLAWRAYVLIDSLGEPTSRLNLVLAVRDLVFALVLALVIYLVRVEVLRARELYADLTAKRRKADLSILERRSGDPEAGTRARLRGALRRLWRAHPTPAERWNVLGDNSVLFAARPLPVLLTGIAAVLIGDQFAAALPWVIPSAPAVDQIVALTQAGLVASVVGIALWRAVVYAAATATRPPSGIATGLWLGGGLVAGELIRGRISGFNWVPLHPWVLVFALAAGVVFCWWTAECVALWLSAWRSKSIFPVVTLVLAGGAVALSAWFVWWQQHGLFYADSDRTVDPEALQAALQEAQGFNVDASMTIGLLAQVLEPLTTLGNRPLVWVSIAFACLVPLAARLPRSGGPLWLERKSDTAATATPPPLRRILEGALIGAVSCWITTAAVSAYLHATFGVGNSAAPLVYATWAALALVLAGVVGSAAATLLVDRYRLSAAVIAASIAVPLGLAGAFGMVKLDGCVDALSVFGDVCTDMPASTASSLVFMLAPHVLIAAVVPAAAMAALVSLSAGVFHRRRTDRPSRRQHPLTRTVLASILCVVTVGTAVTGEVAAARGYTPAGEETDMSGLLRLDTVPPSPEVQLMQIVAWAEYGGEDLMDRLMGVFDGMTTELTEIQEQEFDKSRFRSLCEEAVQVTAEAHRYFPIPDAEAQSAWATALEAIDAVGSLCTTAIDTYNLALFGRALTELSGTTLALSEAFTRLETLLAGSA